MDLGRYICSRIVEYINVNRLFQIPLNTIQRTLYSPLFQELLLKLSKILNEVVRVIIDLPKYQVKKFKNRRSVVLSMLYCCHLTITFSRTPNRAN